LWPTAKTLDDSCLLQTGWLVQCNATNIGIYAQFAQGLSIQGNIL